jgi:hypothetical protein
MPAQLNDSACTLCHPASGKSLAVEDAHRHPYNNPAFNAGVNLTVTSVEGGTGAGGNHQAGDPIQATFTVKDDAGVDLQINSLTRFQMILVGPTSNTQWVLGNINAFDFAFRKSTPFTGNGTIDTPTVGGGSAGEILAIVFTGDNTFSVIGSVSGSLAAGLTVPDGGGNTGNLTYGGVTFKITDGSTNFAAGDRFYFEVVPLASSYTMHVPVDITFELVGDATSGADVFTVGNTPLYWGRQTVFERTALNPGTVLTAGAAVLGRYVAADKAALDAAGIAVGDRVVLNTGEANGEYLTIGRIQTTDDVTGDDLGTADRVWFTTALRYAHSTGAAIQEVTLTARREGVDYNVSNADAGELTLIASRFAAGNPVVVSYRTNGLFGFYRSPGDTLQAVYSAPAADSDDIDATWGDWKGLPLISGTYTVGMWANRDFTLTPLQILTATEGWNNFTSENTTYRIISPPATKGFLFGSATAVESRSMISSGDNCNRCHDDIVFHGFGRRGLETCLLCHSIPGVEDGPKYTFNSWYVGATPGATMDFRMLLHKAHMGKELSKADEYEAIGVFLGTPYPFQAMEIGFPAQPGGAKDCSTCHGTSDAWKEPAARDHESQETPTQVWYTSCNSCHDSDTAVAHANLETDENGVEACAVCHGPGAEFNVEMMHKVR